MADLATSRTIDTGSVVMPDTEPLGPNQIQVMAIFTMPLIECEYDGFRLPDSYCAANGGLNSFYVRWLEAVGIRAVPMEWNAPMEKQIELAKKVNGILFPGGDLDHFGEVLKEYFQRVKRIYEVAVEWNRAGDRFVLWGTCQGFQLLCAAAAGTLDVIEPGFVGTCPLMMPLQFTGSTCRSRFLGDASASANVIASFRDHPSTLNFHRFGVSPSSFQRYPSLADAFDVIATNCDDTGREFVSMIEHKSAAIYGVQFHPEWPPYDFSDARITKSKAVITATLHTSQFIHGELSLNDHQYPDSRSSEKEVVERSPLVYGGFGWQLYWVHAKTEDNGKPKVAAPPQQAGMHCTGK